MSCPRAAMYSGSCGARMTFGPTASGTKRFNHPVVGELTLAYEELIITADPGCVLMIYTAEPGSPSAERLKLLASWSTQQVVETSP